MTAAVYDTGILIAADRNDRGTWAEHFVRLESGLVPLVPAVVAAQASRSDRQAQLRRLLRGCEVVGLDEPAAHRVGALLGKARTSDVVDGAVVELAARMGGEIVTTDAADIRRLVAASGKRVAVQVR